MFLEDKVALVTGASRGIGAATAKELAVRGASVVVNYFQNAEAAEKVVAVIKNFGGKAIAIQADVRDTEQVQRLVKETKEAFGRIDIAVNNANINFAFKSISEMTWEEFAQKLNEEVRSAFDLTKAVAPIMQQQQYGKLIYLSSSLEKAPTYGFVAHGTAKGAIVSFTKYVAQEFAPFGITANAVLPGMVETDATAYTPQEFKQQIIGVTPLGRLAQPEDVAKVIAFLASNDSAFVTGTSVDVNGGIIM